VGLLPPVPVSEIGSDLHAERVVVASASHENL